MEEEAERIYKEERPSIIEDEVASVRDLMYELAEYIERDDDARLEHCESALRE